MRNDYYPETEYCRKIKIYGISNKTLQLTETGVLHWVAVVMVHFVAALALVADDALRGAVASTSLVIAVGGLAVTLAC